MKNVRVDFKLYNGDPSSLKGYKHVGIHLIFDIKLGENFRRKVRCVGDGHRTKPLSSITYSSVVSRDSVRISHLITVLNGLDIECTYIKLLTLMHHVRRDYKLRLDQSLITTKEIRS